MNNTYQVKKGEVLGLLGPNGAGKSTSFNMVTMDLQRTSGEVKLFNTDLQQLDIEEHGPKMGMVTQDNLIWEGLTVDESLQYVCSIKGLSLVEQLF